MAATRKAAHRQTITENIFSVLGLERLSLTRVGPEENSTNAEGMSIEMGKINIIQAATQFT